MPNIHHNLKRIYNMLPEVGKHKAFTTDKAVYENQNGTLIFSAYFLVGEQIGITGYFCLTTKDGAISERNVRTLKDVYGWDGCDPFWLVDNDLSQTEVEIVVEDQTGRDGNPMRSVAWLNKPGSGNGSKKLESGDRANILAKYGSRFRAMAGGSAPSPRPPVSAAPKQPAPRPAAPSLPPPVPREDAPVSDMSECWSIFCEHGNDLMSQEEATDQWFKLIESVAGKSSEKCTPQDWGKIKAEIPNFVI
jgi:hypothetical protein